MGQDAHIYVEAPDGFELGGEPLDHKWKGYPPEATHEVMVWERLWSPEYPRGHWPVISGALMQVLGDLNVKRVWYGGDDGVEEFTAEDVLEYSRVFMKERPEW